MHSQLGEPFPQLATCLPTSSVCRKKPSNSAPPIWSGRSRTVRRLFWPMLPVS